MLRIFLSENSFVEPWQLYPKTTKWLAAAYILCIYIYYRLNLAGRPEMEDERCQITGKFVPSHVISSCCAWDETNFEKIGQQSVFNCSVVHGLCFGTKHACLKNR